MAIPRPGIALFSWIGLVPLLVALHNAKFPQAALYGFLTGAIYFGAVLFWVSLFGYLPWMILTMVEALFFCLFAVISARLMPSKIGWSGYLTVPAAWTAMQWLRSLGTYSLTWGSFAHTQANNLPVIQFSAITGPWGIDFLVCLINIALVSLIYPINKKRRYGPAMVAVSLTALVLGFGITSLHNSVNLKPKVNVAIIQGNLQSDFAAPTGYDLISFKAHSLLSRKAAKNHPDFIVWAETTIPTIISNSWSAHLSALARDTHSNLIIGGYDNNSFNTPSYNSAFFYDRSGRKSGVYHKVRLVPFGEFVPLRDQLPFLSRYNVRAQDVRPGESHELVNTEIGKVGTSICFESLFPQVARNETRQGARALLVMTNDSWFQRSTAARGHLMMAKLRAVENHRYVVRAAVTGISAVIDPYGRTTSELGIYKKGIVKDSIAPIRALTPYTRFGDYFAYACAALVIFTLLLVRSSISKQEGQAIFS